MATTRKKNLIGTHLAKARKAVSLTQLDLSRKVAASGVKIDRAGIAKVLGVEVGWLLTGRQSR